MCPRPVFTETSQTQHPLYLKRRRPDLWSLRLTCENTHTLIPYLTIVNEVLEAYLGDVAGGDIYEQLSDPADKVSFRVPFSLPFAELSLYLGHFGLAPADIYRTLGHPDAKVWRARLGLAPDEAAVIATTRSRSCSRPAWQPSVPGDYDLQAFLRSTGLQRDQLDSVLASRFNPDLAAVTVTSKPTQASFRTSLKSSRTSPPPGSTSSTASSACGGPPTGRSPNSTLSSSPPATPASSVRTSTTPPFSCSGG